LGEAIVLPSVIVGGVARTALGEVSVRHEDATLADVLVRPEQVTVSESGTGALGRVLHRSYRGAQWRLEIDCRDGGVDEPFCVDVPAMVDVKPGDLVRLGVSGEVHVFAR
jgi:iron(III) transport system ATP-binding protein